MTTKSRARLSRNGRDRSLVPGEFEVEGKQAVIRKKGNTRIVKPAKKRQVLALLLRLDPIDDDVPDVEADDGPDVDLES